MRLFTQPLFMKFLPHQVPYPDYTYYYSQKFSTVKRKVLKILVFFVFNIIFVQHYDKIFAFRIEFVHIHLIDACIRHHRHR